MDDIRDIKGPIGLTGGADWLGPAAAAGVLALVGLAVWRWQRCRAAWRDIREGLAALAREAPALDDRAFYYRLTDLAGRALARGLGIAATAMTSAELLARPEVASLPPALHADLAALLGRADAARYAGAAATAAAKTADLATAGRLIGSRRP